MINIGTRSGDGTTA